MDATCAEVFRQSNAVYYANWHDFIHFGVQCLKVKGEWGSLKKATKQEGIAGMVT